MSLKNDILLSSGLLNENEYLNETLFIGSKAFFRNSKRLLKFALALKNKTEIAIKKNKKIDEKAINQLYTTILDTSQKMRTMEDLVSNSKGADKNKAKEMYKNLELECSYILKLMKKNEVTTALIVIGIGSVAALFIGAIALFFGSNPFNAIKQNTSTIETPEIEVPIVDAENSYLQSIKGMTRSAASMGVSMISMNLIRGLFSKLSKTPKVEDAKATMIALKQKEEELKKEPTQKSAIV